MPRRPTLQDVAASAGVGKSTASLALRNDPRLLPETRERIQKIAASLGYHADATVAELMSHLRASRTPKFQATLGLINASCDRHKLTEYCTFTDWVRGCHKRAQQLGYCLDDFWLREPDIDADRLGSILQSRSIRGLVITAVLDDGVLPPDFRGVWEKFSCVVIGVRTTNPRLHCATNDQFDTVRQAFEKILELGYKRPGLVIERKVDENLQLRFSAGFCIGQNRLLPQHRLPICHWLREDPRVFAAWYRDQQPDVIITLHEEIKPQLEEMGVKIPHKVGLVHLDRTVGMPGWSGMNQNNESVGAAAIDVLVGQLHRHEFGIPHVAQSLMIESEWSDGSTTRKR